MKKLIGLALLLNIIAISLNISPVYEIYADEDYNIYRLPVFETSDVHGYIAEKSEDNYQYLLAYISDKVKDIRGYGENYRKDIALLLDGGDIYQGNTMSNLLNGKSLAAAFEIMGYDAVTIGNHEFDWGIENTIDSDGTMMDSNLDGFEMINDVPVVASNLYHNSEKVDWAKDYVIIPKKARNSNGEEITVNIGVIGYLDNYATSIMTSQFTGKGYSIVEDLSIPNNIAKELEDNKLADVTILLCHQDALEVAEKMPKDSAIDIVLGGHSHKNSEGQASNGMLYMQPGSYGKAYTYFELIFKKDNEGKVEFDSIVNMENKSVTENLSKTTNKPENSDELDGEMVSLTDKVIKEVQDVLETKIGYITHSAINYEYLEGSGEFSSTGGNWASSIYARGVNSDVAFTNKSGVRYAFKMPEGKTQRDITIGDIYTNFPFENKIYKYELTGEELLEVLNYGVKDQLHSFITSIVGIDCYYTDNKVNALVKDGVLIYHNGEWKNDWKDKKLTLATNEYVATTDKILTGGVHNPLVKWNDSSRLIDKEKIDSDCAVKVLTDEAKEKDGLLEIDLTAHYIEGNYGEQPKEYENIIGYIKHSATNDEYIQGSGKFSTTGGNWASSIYARGVNSDVAFGNRTGVKSAFKIPEGKTQRDITIGDIYTNFAFKNKIYKYELTGEELLEVLNYGLKDKYYSFISSIVGIDCYHTDNKVNALVKDGVLIYHNGEWKDNWKDKKLTLATNEYVAKTDKVLTGGVHNPLVNWNDSSRLIDNEKVDTDLAIKVLTDEAKEKDGLLEIDLTAHYIEGNYEEQPKEYEYIEGGNQIYRLGEDNVAIFIINADYSLFKTGGKIYVDGKEVNSSNYTSENENNIIIKLKHGYMNSLGSGIHSLKVVFNNGYTAETSFTITNETENQPLKEVLNNGDTAETSNEIKNLATGDNIVFSFSMLALDAIGLIGIIIFKKNKLKKQD